MSDPSTGTIGWVEVKKAGTRAVVTGGNFKAAEKVTILSNNPAGASILLPVAEGTATASQSGAFQVTVTIPAALVAGSPYTVIAAGDKNTVAYGVMTIVNKDPND